MNKETNVITLHIAKSKKECAEYFADEFIEDVAYPNAGTWHYGFSLNGVPDSWWFNWNGQRNVDVIVGRGTSDSCAGYDMNGHLKGLPCGTDRETVIKFFMREINRFCRESMFELVFESKDKVEENQIARHAHEELMMAEREGRY